MTEITGVFAIIALLVLASIPLGRYVAAVFAGKRTWSNFMLPLERFIFRLAGVDSEAEYSWQKNMKLLIGINIVFFVWAFGVLMLQNILPLNPNHIPAMEPTQAFNTAVSFMANTNLQHYSGETGASFFSQQFVFVFLQFVTSATGMAALALVFRAFTKSESTTTGNFWTFFVRANTRILLPLAFVFAVVFLVRGMPMNYDANQATVSLQGDAVSVAQGPVAAMIPIKQLGTNGGGFFGPNSAHPFENPDYLTNALEVMGILLIPMALVVAFGIYTGQRKIGIMLFTVMMAGFMLLLVPAIAEEMKGNASLPAVVNQQANLGSMEGKEVRFGPAATAQWAIITTVTSCGAVNGMHDSLTPLTGSFTLLAMMVNCFFGGVGVGFLNMFIFLILAVFIASLMIGRTPELMGKKIEPHEVKIAAMVFLLHPLLILLGTGISSFMAAHDPALGMMGNQAGKLGWLNNPGFHGFSEMLYEFTSSSANNGSGFEGLGDNTPFWNIGCGIVMLLARLLPIVGPVAIAGSLAAKRTVPASSGTLDAGTTSFGVLLFFVILVLSALAFFPALAMGPLAEYLSA